MHTGMLRTKIEILKPKEQTPVRNKNPEEAYEAWKTVWASVECTGNDAMHVASADVTSSKIACTIRYRHDVTNKMAILLDGQYYRITGIDPTDFTNSWLILRGEVVTNRGQ